MYTIVKAIILRFEDLEVAMIIWCFTCFGTTIQG
jgi:hypothetical protein